MGVQIVSNATVVVRDLILDADHGDGAALFALGSDVTLRDVEIRDSDHSGAFVTGGSTLTAFDVAFRDNVGDFGGGGLAVDIGSTATLERATFERNRAPTNAGGGALAGGVLTVRSSAFVDNEAIAGAGIYCYGAEAACRVDDSVFSGGVAETEGGAINGIDVGTIEVRRSVFCDNTASASKDAVFYGGTVSLWEVGAPVVLKNNVFANNTCPAAPGKAFFQAGAVLLGNASAEVVNNTFIGNAAGYSSGLFLLVLEPFYDPLDIEIDVTNNLFQDNGGDIAQAAFAALPGGGYNPLPQQRERYELRLRRGRVRRPAAVGTRLGCGVWRLAKGSPAIDAGDPDPPSTTPTAPARTSARREGPKPSSTPTPTGGRCRSIATIATPRALPSRPSGATGSTTTATERSTRTASPSPRTRAGARRRRRRRKRQKQPIPTARYGARSSASSSRLVGGACACAGSGGGLGAGWGGWIGALVAAGVRRGRRRTGS